MEKSEDGKALVNVQTMLEPAAAFGTFKMTVRFAMLGLLATLTTELVQDIPVSTNPLLGKLSVKVNTVFKPGICCAAPVTATPAVTVVIFGKVKRLEPVKLKVPVPPVDTFAMATVVGLAVLVYVQVILSPGAGVKL